jgi:sugar lactone lactonase YvrE
MTLTRAVTGFLFFGSALFAPAQAQQYIISTYAGGAPPPTPTLSVDEAIGYTAALAGYETGNLYFVSFNCVFRLDRSGVITRVAGISAPGYSGDGGPAMDAQLSRPGGLALDGAGNLFIADTDNHRIRKVSADGIITTVAGNGLPGFSGDGGPAIDAQLYLPSTLTVDGNGNLFILDWGDTYSPDNAPGKLAGNRVRRLSRDGIITTVAGNGVPGFAGDDGPAIAAQLSRPGGIAADAAGNLFIADTYNQRIRKVSSDGIITTVVSSRASNPDCLASLSPLLPLGLGSCGSTTVAVDREGNLFFDELGFDEFLGIVTYASRLRKLSPDGIITTVAGTDTPGYSGDGGRALDAQIGFASVLTVDGAGTLFFADSLAHIRKISPEGIITTAAGNGKYYPEPIDDIPATSAHLTNPSGVAVDRAGNLFIQVATGIRRISASGIINTVVRGVPCGYSYRGPSNVFTSNTPGCLGGAMAADNAGNLFFQEYFRVRKLAPDGAIITVAGNGTQGYSGDGGPAVDAQLSSAVDGLAVDGAGNLFIADDLNRRVRRVSPGGIITTVAGNGTTGHSGDGGVATSAELYGPFSIAVDAAGNLFLTELGVIRKVSRNGIITTITGNGGLWADYSGEGGPASSATGVWGQLAVDGAGNLFVASGGHIRKISTDGLITTVPGDGLAGSSIAADTAGNVYIADSINNVIRILRPVNGPF